MPIPISKAPGDWHPTAYRTVAAEMTGTLDLGPFAPQVIDALVHVHFSVYAAIERLKRRQGRMMQLGPRFFLDFIHHYVTLSNEKREALEEEQRHLNVGLDKLKETVDAVSELQKNLAVKRTQLEAKNKEANEKLQRMVADQKSAEEQKLASIQIQGNLEKQEKEIAERREVVMGDLADAEPAVQEAQASVSNIKKQHLTEVRSMGNPPAPVKMAMESVCMILGHRIDSWKSVQAVIRRDDFIASIVNFDTDRMMTKAVREKMKREYLSKPGYDFATIDRASKACGPLAKWVIAQVRFSEILDRVGPLRAEVDSLEEQAQETKQQANTIVEMIKELEGSIVRYKDEYAALISETQAIKSEMASVQRRVDRSIQLLDSLGSEKQRWEASSRTFDTQMSTIVGDALLSAAFLAYAGFFDQQYRENMWATWADHLSQAGVKFKPELSFSDYLSTADDRLRWADKSLPTDTLCTENAIMLKRYSRYPLIIDPSGQATTFLINEYKDRKLTVTSFLDDAFLKNLEGALRFGNPILIQDVEHLDPILNPILNKELRRTGGRVLIRLGSQEIDFSPSFTLFLSTKDPSVEFPSDVCSRVTFVNFTMTRSSLQSQSLDQVLKAERPETDRKRTDLMKLQGEFRLRLRHLEKSLLNALNESQGNILDDDKVIDTLETLKKEAAEVTRKVEETDIIMQEVEDVTAEYLPLAKACSAVFFVLDQLSLISHFYQFSLQFFLDIFDYVLRQNPHLQGVSDPKERLRMLNRDLFLIVFQRTSRALAHEDHVMLALLLARIWRRENDQDDALESAEYSFLLEGDIITSVQQLRLPGPLEAALSSEQKQRLTYLKRLPIFKEIEARLNDNVDSLLRFISSDQPETALLELWDECPPVVDSIRHLLIIKALRPDRLVPAMGALVTSVFGTDLLSETSYDLQSVVAKEIEAATPIALCSVPGFDASYRVDALTRTTGIRCISVAMGSQEGFALADQAINIASRSGQWVLLKNVHLAPSWLSQLEKKLSGAIMNRQFRIFLTMETNPVIPINFLRASRILMNEPPPGLKANMLDSLRGLSPSRLQKGPAESARLFFLLAFFHATITERLRYTPLGWSKAFEFNDSDAEAALNTIEAWLGRTAKGRSNIDPASIPWGALRALLKQSIYGGKVDNNADQLLLDTFVDKIFTPAAYENGFALVRDTKASLLAPEGSKMDQFMAWVEALPDQQPPEWLALPPSAERVIATVQGSNLLNKLVRMRQLADDDETVDASTGQSTAGEASTQPAWMKALQGNVQTWLELLPESLASLSGTSDGMADPLQRFWAREHRSGTGLLSRVRADLSEVVSVCTGQSRQTNHNRSLLNDLPKGIIPASWSVYAVPKSMLLGAWIADLAQRLQQLSEVSKETRLEAFSVQLGLLFSPGAYMTATRQAVAHRAVVSLEHLQLDLKINEQPGGAGGFALTGLRLDGATWTEGRLELNDGATVYLDTCTLVWQPKPDGALSIPIGALGSGTVPISVYLNADRSNPLFNIALPTRRDEDPSAFAQRAVALRAA
ncbi:cytoplasmic dynein heavy chain 2 [Tilletiaria anomala UBC 951]|uniref:Dynein heavy chain, cytoplasmic n=1 Tax=Tilletiaria anomala (strain ATCC 24038 / CBS 436.72 / UBC 951) TaxID=1037660 RepID=A0A066WL70_TILAU|nr:cytoplasmic dynein heavy chain 2 [Tilletiaria anomala UBC 951]KDN51345.1 cytoplasmic dynein heavy chain 2 [Tilletiaria anomala UBC 951]